MTPHGQYLRLPLPRKATLFTFAMLFVLAIQTAPVHAQCARGAAFGAASFTQLPVPGGWACAAGDIDNDGYDDAVFLGARSMIVVKMGAANLASGQEFTVGRVDGELAIALQDLNGDGVLDIIYMAETKLVVLLANVVNGVWQRTFANALSSASLSGPRRMAFGDLNGDGHLDAVVGSVGSTIAIHLGVAGGGLAAGQFIALGTSPFSVGTGDFNGDGFDDVVVAGLTGEVWVMLATRLVGGPVLGTPTRYTTFGVPLALAVADLNRDGALDFACSDAPGRADVFMGRKPNGVPDGTFASAVSVPMGANTPYGFAAVDIDGDNNIDLVSGNNDGNVSLARGRGDGTFETAELYSTGSPGNDIAVADMNGDSAPDLIVGGSSVGVMLPGGCPHVANPPQISQFTPGGGAPGDRVRIFGAFIADPLSVSINGAPCQVTSGQAYPVVIEVPANATTGPIQIVTRGGSALSVIDFVVGPHPVITSFSPASARPGQVVTVAGNHLASTTACAFSGGRSANFTVISDQQLDLTVNGGAQTGPIRVTTPTGEVLSAAPFTVLPPDSAARIVSVRDVRNDQGGKVIVRWTRSEVDDTDLHAISRYRVWRRAPLDPSSPLRSMPAAGPPPGPGWYWESIGEVPAAYLSGYSFTASTPQDSIGAEPGWTAFFVQAIHENNLTFYFSNVDSGYSVDNLAPRAPSPLVADYAPSGNLLHWPASAATDFAQFRLYRGTTSDFTPSSSNLRAALRDTSFRDTEHGAFTYKLVSLDVHGNASRVVSVSPNLPVSTLASLVSAKAFADHTELVWFSEGARGTGANLYRWSEATDWQLLRAALPDGNGLIRYRDESISAGQVYRYRLGIDDGGIEAFFGETELVIPLPGVVLRLATPNPSQGRDIRCIVSIPDASSGTLELVDIAGRLVAREELLGPLSREVRLATDGRTAAGVYLIRLRTGSSATTRRVVLVP